MQATQPDNLGTSLEDERRQFQRWEPEETTAVCVSSAKGDWSGRVLNLSEGGSEVLGLPPRLIRLGTPVVLEIAFRGCVVTREGTLQSIRSLTARNSHVVAFENCRLEPESQFVCPCCGTIQMCLSDLSGAASESLFCGECEDRASEELGRDYDYDELGWGD